MTMMMKTTTPNKSTGSPIVGEQDTMINTASRGGFLCKIHCLTKKRWLTISPMVGKIRKKSGLILLAADVPPVATTVSIDRSIGPGSHFPPFIHTLSATSCDSSISDMLSLHYCTFMRRQSGGYRSFPWTLMRVLFGLIGGPATSIWSLWRR